MNSSVRKLKTAILTGIILLFAGILFTQRYYCMHVRVVTRERFEKIQKDLEEQDSFDPGILRYEGVVPPYDEAERTLYLPQSMQKDSWKGSLSAVDPRIRLYFLDDGDFDDKKEIMRSGRPLSLLVVEGKKYVQLNVIITGLPAVVMYYDDSEGEVGREDLDAEFSLIDPEHVTRSRTSLSLFCRFHIRGATSAQYEKKNYRLHLCDIWGKKEKRKLLNITDSDDWILHAMYTDETRIREKIAYQLWSDINALDNSGVYSPRIEYTELFINDHYQGVYGLMPPLDKKTAAVKKDDTLYKISQDFDPREDEYEKALFSEKKSWMEDRKGNPRIEIKAGMPDWDPMKKWQDLGRGRSSSRALQEAGYVVDETAVLNMNWFEMLINTVDNDWKNTYLTARRQGDGKSRLIPNIWDLNYSFGTVWSDENILFQIFDPESADIRKKSYYMPVLAQFYYLYREDPQRYRSMSLQKLKQWGDAGLNAEYLCSLAQDAHDQLLESGALRRESMRWQENPVAEDIRDLQKWIRSRYRSLEQDLDIYFEMLERTY